MTVISGDISVWIEFDAEDNVSIVEILVDPVMLRVHDVFADWAGNPTEVTAADAEKVLHEADWPRPRLVLDNQEAVQL